MIPADASFKDGKKRPIGLDIKDFHITSRAAMLEERRRREMMPANFKDITKQWGVKWPPHRFPSNIVAESNDVIVSPWRVVTWVLWRHLEASRCLHGDAPQCLCVSMDTYLVSRSKCSRGVRTCSCRLPPLSKQRISIPHLHGYIPPWAVLSVRGAFEPVLGGWVAPCH